MPARAAPPPDHPAALAPPLLHARRPAPLFASAPPLLTACAWPQSLGHARSLFKHVHPSCHGSASCTAGIYDVEPWKMVGRRAGHSLPHLQESHGIAKRTDCRPVCIPAAPVLAEPLLLLLPVLVVLVLGAVAVRMRLWGALRALPGLAQLLQAHAHALAAGLQAHARPLEAVAGLLRATCNASDQSCTCQGHASALSLHGSPSGLIGVQRSGPSRVTPDDRSDF